MPTQPPDFRVTNDNWLLTPLTDAQFTWIVSAIEKERIDKAERIINTIADVPALASAMDAEEISSDNVPVLEWASPKEFERVVAYALMIRNERDQSRLIIDTLMNLAETHVGVDKTQQAIKDTLDLADKLSEVPTLTPNRLPTPESQADWTENLEPGILGTPR